MAVCGAGAAPIWLACSRDGHSQPRALRAAQHPPTAVATAAGCCSASTRAAQRWAVSAIMASSWLLNVGPASRLWQCRLRHRCWHAWCSAWSSDASSSGGGRSPPAHMRPTARGRQVAGMCVRARARAHVPCVRAVHSKRGGGRRSLQQQHEHACTRAPPDHTAAHLCLPLPSAAPPAAARRARGRAAARRLAPGDSLGSRSWPGWWRWRPGVPPWCGRVLEGLGAAARLRNRVGSHRRLESAFLNSAAPRNHG